jgi:hypothetical protein
MSVKHSAAPVEGITVTVPDDAVIIGSPVSFEQ